MKQIVLLILISIVIPSKMASQSWTSETVWVYETDEFGPPISGNYLILRIISDTIIDNELFFKLQEYSRNHVTGDLTLINEGFIFLQYENDKIYLLGQTDSTKHLIYDFSLQAGESYLAYCDFDKNYFTVRIDSVGEFIQNGIRRKVQFVSSENVSGCYLHGKIIEGVGFEEYILPRYTTVDPPPGGYIACFNDGLFSYPIELNCEDLITSNKSVPSDELKFYPNPTSDIIYLECDLDKHYEIYNATGNLVEVGNVVHNSIRTDKLPRGIYFIRIRQKNKESIHKFIRQ